MARREGPILNGLQWEGDCQFIFATLKQYKNWIAQSQDCGLFSQYDPELHWAYADYIYVKNLFDDTPGYNVFSKIHWSNLGYSQNEGHDMAIWLGSKGAHTLCHYDTYGYNLVVQICGRKRWILFPPSDSSGLYPTRIPYEESTIFSKVNLLNPILSEHPKFSTTRPHIIVLEPGDLLFVPPHWWHFVENLEESISVNAWFPAECDSEQRINEALTRLLIGSAVCYQSADSTKPANEKAASWINPTESSVTNLEGNMNLLRNALSSNSDHTDRNEDSNKTYTADPCSCSPDILPPLSDVNCSYVQGRCFAHASKIVDHWKHFIVHDTYSASKRRCVDRNVVTSGPVELTLESLIDCLTKPHVINYLRREVTDTFGQRYSRNNRKPP